MATREWQPGHATPPFLAMPMRVIVLGEFDETLLPEDVTPERVVSTALDRCGRISVPQVLRDYRQPPEAAPLLLVTAHDLSQPGCDSLFGYANQSGRVAIVSTYRLYTSNAAQTRRRLANVMAHEYGHLEGNRHCSTPNCLMYPARRPEDIDARSLESCGRCPRAATRLVHVLAVAAAVALTIASLDRIGHALRFNKEPFSWSHQNGEVQLTFRKSPLLALGHENTFVPARAEALARSLNSLYLQIHPPAMEVVPTENGKALIRAGNAPLIEMEATGAVNQTAQQWIAQIEPILKSKGLKGENCANCHIDRISQIDYEISRKGLLKR